jgi:anthranilate phosphoribosyltransferase
MGVRTAFNLLGPLTNPAGATRQVVGVPRADLTDLLARSLRLLGSTRAWVVHGADGIDEISTTATPRCPNAARVPFTRSTSTRRSSAFARPHSQNFWR